MDIPDEVNMTVSMTGFRLFLGDLCQWCSRPDWSGFQCCDECAERLAKEFK